MVTSGCAATKAAGRATGTSGPRRAVELPEATTYLSLAGAALDPGQATTPGGTVLGLDQPRTIHARPDGPAVAMLPARQLGGPTWVPVVGSAPGWYQVLLPSRPNRSTGWIKVGRTGLRIARSAHVVKVALGARRLTLLKSGRRLGTWPVAVGAAKTPTPVGRTFLLASLTPSKPGPSPLILPLGVHSETLDSFGGGPGTVAFHGWPDRSVFGRAVTHGCVRVPPDALRALSLVPLGTPVLITR